MHVYGKEEQLDFEAELTDTKITQENKCKGDLLIEGELVLLPPHKTAVSTLSTSSAYICTGWLDRMLHRGALQEMESN